MSKSSIFDMIGPIMIGPSSSHTGGVVRIGSVARMILGIQPEKVVITFYNSFARTYEGHGSDRAILAGLLGMNTDDERIKQAYQEAEAAGLQYVMKAVMNASTMHPNTIRLEMTCGEKKAEVVGVSRGGGLISIVEIDGFACNFTAQSKTLVITADDVKGSVAFITNVIAHDNCNIATMTVNRSGKNDIAKMVIEMDTSLNPITLQYLQNLSWVKAVDYLDSVD
ncbi:MAG: L-serine ammonia-lyase, iron-sulfur-dependent subunit beta [Bacteroidia bacterium]